MSKKKSFKDKRVKKKLFPIPVFFSAFAVFAVFTTFQMKIIGDFIDYKSIPIAHQISLVVFWILIAALFTVLTNYQIRKYYQKPI